MRIARSNHALQRQENSYQNKRLKKYAETQNLLKELQTHPEVLQPRSAPKQLSALQTVLLLSAITAAFPTRTQAAITKGYFNQKNTDPNTTKLPEALASQPPQHMALNHSSGTHPLLSLPSPRTHQFLDVAQLVPPQKRHSPEAPLNRLMRNAQHVSQHTTTTSPSTKSNYTSLPYTVRTRTKNRCISAPRNALQSIKRLHIWMNQTAALEKVIARPWQALGAVLSHHQTNLPESFFTTLNPCILHRSDWQWIDEAAQLWHEAQQRQSTTIKSSTSMPLDHATSTQQDNIKNNHPVRGLRKKFLAGLKLDIKKETLLKKLFTPTVNGTNAEVFFDGIALCGAIGKNLDDLVALHALAQIPQYAALIDAEKKALLIEKFERMGESTHYKVGTTAYSLDSIIQRCRTFQGQPTEYFANEKALLEQFDNIAQRWQTQHNYPLEPQFALAQHLAHARGVEIRQHDWQTDFLKNEMDPWLKGFYNTTIPMQIREINNWLYTIKQETSDEPLERKSAQTICEELQEIAYCARVPKNKRPPSLQAAHFYIAREAPNERYEQSDLCSTDNTIPQAIVAFSKAMQEKNALPRGEVITGDTLQQRIMALSKYRDEVFSNNYTSSPQFNREQAVRTILHQHGFNDTQIDARRLYNTGPKLGTGATLVQDKEGTGIDEFLERSKKEAQSDGAIMSVTTAHGTTQIKTTGLLRTVMLQWDNDLHTQPWIQARARENLRLAQAPLTNTTIEAEAHDVAQRYQIGIAEQDIAGVENTLINLIPFIGGLYNIEEGIRHRDPGQIIGGVFSLATDSFTSGIGAIAEIESRFLGTTLKVPHTEHAIVDMIKGVAHDLDVPVDELIPLQSAADEIGVHIHADPWKISLPDTNVPDAYRSLATRVRQGEQNVMWTAPAGEQHPVIRVINQDRIIAAKHIGGTYHEVSWETGQVLHHTQLIYYDKQGKNYFSMGLKGGGQSSGKLSGNTIVNHMRLKDRYTVDALKTLFKKIPPAQPIQFSTDEIQELFTTHFPALPLHARENGALWQPLEHHLYTKLYFKSDTFQRLVNLFFEKNKNSWKVDFTAKNPPRITRLRQGSLHPIISIPNNNEITKLRYFGVDRQLHAFTQEQVYLDAILEAMNGSPHTIGSTAVTSRSPNIVLRDRILFEAGFPPLPQQISSCVVGIDAETGEEINYTPLHQQPILIPLLQDLKTFELENRFMDEKWLNKGMTISANKELFGTPISERTTVKDVEQFYRDTEGVLTFLGLRKSFKPRQIFSFAESNRDFLNDFYENISRKSLTFHRYWEEAVAKGLIGEQKWLFFTYKESLQEAGSAQLIAEAKEYGFAVNTESKMIYVPTNNIRDVYYLSDEGFIAMQKERKLINAVIQMLLPMAPPVEKWINRGGQVFFTEYILEEMDLTLPPQIAYGRIKGSEIRNGLFVGSGTNPLIYQTAARRARDMEDAYISQMKMT